MKKDSKKQDKPSVNWEDVAKRALADLDNYKKQQEKLRGEMTQFMNMMLLAKVLSVYEDLKRLLKGVQEAKFDTDKVPAEVLHCQKGAMDGIESILKKFADVFKSEGLEPLEVEPGIEFDPNTMEAVSYEENKVGEGKVIGTFEAGLKHKDKIIKPAKVRVGKWLK